MTPEETGKILAAIAGRDSRTVGRSDVLAWHEDIGDLDYADCLPAVSEHFRNSEARIMPVHVRRIALERRRDRSIREQTAAALAIEPDRPTGAEAAAVHARLRKTIADAVAARNARDAARQDADADLETRDDRWVPNDEFRRGTGNVTEVQQSGGWNFRPVEGGGWYSGPDPYPSVTPNPPPGMCSCRAGEGNHEFGVEGCKGFGDE